MQTFKNNKPTKTVHFPGASLEFVQVQKTAFHLELSLSSYLDRTCIVVVKRPKTGVFGSIKCLFILTGAAHGARSILSNTAGVIQGTTPPTSLIYFFMQITIKAIASSENKKHRPQSRAQFIRVISVTGGHLQSFYHFFHMTPMGDICWARLPRQGQRRRETLACGGVSDMMTRDTM